MELIENRVLELESKVQQLEAENQTMKEKLTHFQEMFNNIYCLLFKFIKRPDGKFEYTFLSGKTAQNNGLTPNLIVGKTPEVLFDSSTVSMVADFYERAYEGKRVHFDLNYRNFTYEVTLIPLKVNGLTVEVMGTAIDVTEKKQIQGKMETNHNKFTALFEEALDAIVLFDDTGIPIEANPAASRLLGFTTEEIKRAEHFALLDPKIRNRMPETLERLKEAGTLSGESTVTNKDRTIRHVEHVTKANILPGVHLTILRDITQRKKLEESIRKSETLNVVGELAAGIGHEIRNPMTSIKGFIQLIKEDPSNIEYYNVILNEFQIIETVISELMVLSKPQANRMTEENLQEIALNTLVLLDVQARPKNIQLHLEVEEDLPTIICEKNQMKQVFIHFIKNGIEAMESGQNLWVRIRRGAGSNVLIEIEDEGCGIPKERLDKLGEPFYTTKEKGTGLGMMMSYKIIQNHKGTIKVESQEGVGTIFTITLPITIQP
ncbi:ATP-binding protein [Pseudalkalibacillus sp. Hm43]|uniref:ATP-binding protein n=1 Tax=Pseudalkalibacillus sp. Hm43 TaxID=3450742 RepID=UPI003F43627D